MADVIFICNANMCRSPLAEGILKGMLFKAACSATVSSMGIHAQDGRSATDMSVTIASEHAIDLSNHRSRPLIPEELLTSRLIFTMEPVQVDYIDLFFPQVSDRLFMLSAWPQRKNKKRTIGDPVGRSLDVHRKVFIRISEYLEALLPDLLYMFKPEVLNR